MAQSRPQGKTVFAAPPLGKTGFSAYPRRMADTLPITAVLDDVATALASGGRAVLQAPPGAGKTTLVPLHLLATSPGKIVMLEPRRLAARHAAERIAHLHGTPLGQVVGYRMRGQSKTSATARIEVVTEGVLIRMLQSDPDLSGIGLVIFDEFHERALTADLGLALCLEVVEALRPDLRLLVMSATLDAGPVADLLGALVITSQGRSFDVTARYLDRPLAPGNWEPALHALVRRALGETQGGVLVFLPGEAEIRRAQAALSATVPQDCRIQPLYGGLPFAEQRKATAPLAQGRKIVLATAIAETSLTIPDISVVVDAGRARRARFDPNSGMSRLVTERAARAEATQRAGRAGRLGPGLCYKLWTKGEDGAMASHALAEIETADLAPLALELANWGAEPGDLAFLTPPNAGHYAEARQVLRQLGALDGADRITPHGRALATLPLHPRLAHMLQVAGPQAAPLAALLNARDVMPEAGSDLTKRVRRLQDRGGAQAPHDLRQEMHRLARLVPDTEAERLSAGEMAALAYPDRVALRRKGTAARYLMSGGKGAYLRDDDPQATQRLLAVTDLDGNAREARIRQAAPITESALRGLFESEISWQNVCSWSTQDNRVLARQQERLGALALQDRLWKDVPDAAVARAFLDGVRLLGLRFSPAATRFRDRVALARQQEPTLPDLSEAALLDGLETWLLPHVAGLRSKADWAAFDALPALRAMLDWTQAQSLERLVPSRFTTPLGREVPIAYGQAQPSIAVRLQEMFGVTTHPTVAGQALLVTLLSPAGRPVQTTQDLPGFWHSSYADVRKDMRGRYPKHPWPEDPTQAAPTSRAKTRPK